MSEGGNRSVAAEIIKAYTYVGLWIGLSGAVIMFNKYLLAYAGFPYPITLTMWCVLRTWHGPGGVGVGLEMQHACGDPLADGTEAAGEGCTSMAVTDVIVDGAGLWRRGLLAPGEAAAMPAKALARFGRLAGTGGYQVGLAGRGRADSAVLPPPTSLQAHVLLRQPGHRARQVGQGAVDQHGPRHVHEVSRRGVAVTAREFGLAVAADLLGSKTPCRAWRRNTPTSSPRSYPDARTR